MQNGVMLIDGNSLGHAMNAAGKLTIGPLQVQAISGFLRSLRQTLATYPQLTPIVLWDGTSWRLMKFPSYKEIRDKDDTKAQLIQQEAKLQYTKQRPIIKGALRALGVAQAEAFNMEADDLAAILSDKYTKLGRKVMLLSGDKDWIQLVNKNVTWRDVIDRKGRKRMIFPSDLKEQFGVDTVQQFIEVKALAGDQGDSVPGVGRIGEQGAIEFLGRFESFSNFMNMWTFEKSVTDAEFKKLPKKFRDLILDEEKAVTFARNIELVDLHTPARPEPNNFKIDPGAPDADKFRALCDRLLFNSFTEDLDNWLSVFPKFKPARKEVA